MIPAWILGALAAALGYLIGYKAGSGKIGVAASNVGVIKLKDQGGKKIKFKSKRMKTTLAKGVKWRVINENPHGSLRTVKLVNWDPFDPLTTPAAEEVPGQSEKRIPRDIEPDALGERDERCFTYTIEVDGEREDPELYIKK